MSYERGGHEEAAPTPPIQGEIDATSMREHPDYVPPADFAQQFATPTEVSHGESPEERVVALSDEAERERIQARKFHAAAFLHGGLGMCFGSAAMFIAQKMQGGLSPQLEAVRTVTEHGSYITAMLGGLVMIVSTANAGRHYTRAAEAEALFTEAVQAYNPNEA